MQVIVSPSAITGSVTVPASKSVMQRACAAALLKGGRTVLQNPGTSADDEAALNIIQQLGAIVEKSNGEIIINSKGIKPVSTNLHCGESGLSVRMFTPIAALSPTAIVISGSGSLVKRPLHFFDEVLPKLGVEIKSNNGLLPLQVKGPLTPKNISVDGSLSSQFLTGLLFAFSAANANDVTISVNNLNSKPYIDLSLQVMESFGLNVPEHDDYKSFHFSSTSNINDKLAPGSFFVEGDWSGAAFLLVAGAIAGEVNVKGLNKNSVQSDKAILKALEDAGAQIDYSGNEISVRAGKLAAFEFDAIDAPDLFPPLVALASCCKGKSVITGVHRLIHKESNRSDSLRQEFQKLGVTITIENDAMLIEGGSGIKSANVNSHHDHRIAMACGVAALKADGDVFIEGAEAVNKSYPLFWQHLKSLGAALSLKD
jgi:3-phosphoshikimate 1-carboxyvinyltransferase